MNGKFRQKYLLIEFNLLKKFENNKNSDTLKRFVDQNSLSGTYCVPLETICSISSVLYPLIVAHM